MRPISVILVALVVVLCASYVNGYNVSIRFGADIGKIASSYPFGDEPSGLFTIPSNGGAAVKHRKLFNYALNVINDLSTKLLWAFPIENTGGGKVWNTSSWVAADLDDPNFNPTPVVVIPDGGAQFIFDNGLLYFNFLPSLGDGLYYQVLSDSGTFNVYKWNSTGNATLFSSYTIADTYFGTYVITADFKYLFHDRTDYVCANNICDPPSIDILAIAADYSSITYVGNFKSQCSNETAIAAIQISPDGDHLLAICAGQGLEIFDITDPTKPVSKTFKTKGDSGQDFNPQFLCQYPGGLIAGGYADGVSLSAWLNAVNDTYYEVNAMTSPEPLQVAAFPATETLQWCAITQAAHVINEGFRRIEFFKTSDPSKPFSSTQVACPGLTWAGTVAGHESFSHTADTACNCIDKTSKPCPPGMQLLSSDGNLTPFLNNYSKTWDGYFLSGRDYLEAGVGTLATTYFSNETWPISFVNVDPADGYRPTPDICDDQGNVVINSAAAAEISGKWVIIAPRFLGTASQCSPVQMSAMLNQSGALGIMRSLMPGQVLGYTYAPGFNFPYFTISYSMYTTFLNAWNATVMPPTPVSLPPNGVDSLASFSFQAGLVLVCALFGRFVW